MSASQADAHFVGLAAGVIRGNHQGKFLLHNMYRHVLPLGFENVYMVVQKVGGKVALGRRNGWYLVIIGT